MGNPDEIYFFFFLDDVHHINVTDLIPGTNGTNKGKESMKLYFLYSKYSDNNCQEVFLVKTSKHWTSFFH